MLSVIIPYFSFLALFAVAHPAALLASSDQAPGTLPNHERELTPPILNSSSSLLPPNTSPNRLVECRRLPRDQRMLLDPKSCVPAINTFRHRSLYYIDRVWPAAPSGKIHPSQPTGFPCSIDLLHRPGARDLFLSFANLADGARRILNTCNDDFREGGIMPVGWNVDWAISVSGADVKKKEGSGSSSSSVVYVGSERNSTSSIVAL